MIDLKYDIERSSDLLFGLTSRNLGIFLKSKESCDFVTKIPIQELGAEIEVIYGYIYLLSQQGNIHFFTNITTEGISFFGNFSLFENERRNEQENQIANNHTYLLSYKKPFSVVSDGHFGKIYKFDLPRPEEWWLEMAYKVNPLVLVIGFAIGAYRIFKKKWGNDF